MDLAIPISYCRICDAGRRALDVPEEPCGHDDPHRAVFYLEVVAVDAEARLPGDESNEGNR